MTPVCNSNNLIDRLDSMERQLEVFGRRFFELESRVNSLSKVMDTNSEVVEQNLADLWQSFQKMTIKFDVLDEKYQDLDRTHDELIHGCEDVPLSFLKQTAIVPPTQSPILEDNSMYQSEAMAWPTQASHASESLDRKASGWHSAPIPGMRPPHTRSPNNFANSYKSGLEDNSKYLTADATIAEMQGPTLGFGTCQSSANGATNAKQNTQTSSQTGSEFDEDQIQVNNKPADSYPPGEVFASADQAISAMMSDFHSQ